LEREKERAEKTIKLRRTKIDKKKRENLTKKGENFVLF